MDSTGPTTAGIKTLTTIGVTRDKVTEIETSLVPLVAKARVEGCSWRMIGVALGTTTQAAWEKYGNHEPRKQMPDQDTLPGISSD